MTDFQPFRLVKPVPPVTTLAPTVAATLWPDMQAGVCAHCHDWTVCDDVFAVLRKSGHVICLRCSQRITGTLPHVRRAVRRDAGEAAANEKAIPDSSSDI